MQDIDSAYMTPQEIREMREESAHVYFESTFSFLKAHKGLRPGEMHLLLATSGSGKSTLTRKIMMDCAEQYSVLAWLSEETRENFVSALSSNYPKKEIAENIKIISEMGIDPRYTNNPINLFNKFADHIKLLNPRVVFFDNITTSRMYMGLRPNEQDAMAWRLKNLFEELGIACFLVAHTKSEVSDSMARLIEDTDIRGSKSISNLIPYLYIFQRFQVGSLFFPTIRIRKSRGHRIKNSLYKLTYSMDANTYVSDKALDFIDFKNAFKQRNVL